MGPPRLPASAPTATATAVSMLQQTQQEAEQQVVVQPALSSVSLVGSTVSNVSQVMAGEGNQPPQTVKIRVPSYTDRIWWVCGMFVLWVVGSAGLLPLTLLLPPYSPNPFNPSKPRHPPTRAHAHPLLFTTIDIDPNRIHSLPLLDRALSFRAYELCDALWESDHRPVSAVLHLDLRPALDAHR